MGPATGLLTPFGHGQHLSGDARELAAVTIDTPAAAAAAAANYHLDAGEAAGAVGLHQTP